MLKVSRNLKRDNIRSNSLLVLVWGFPPLLPLLQPEHCRNQGVMADYWQVNRDDAELA